MSELQQIQDENITEEDWLGDSLRAQIDYQKDEISRLERKVAILNDELINIDYKLITLGFLPSVSHEALDKFFGDLIKSVQAAIKAASEVDK